MIPLTPEAPNGNVQSAWMLHFLATEMQKCSLRKDVAPIMHPVFHSYGVRAAGFVGEQVAAMAHP